VLRVDESTDLQGELVATPRKEKIGYAEEPSGTCHGQTLYSK